MWPWYLILDLALWAITAVIIRWSWPRLDPVVRKCVFITVFVVMVLQVLNELLSLHVFKAWDFSEDYNRLLGINLWGAPIEEYLFWFAYAWMIPFLYSGLAGGKSKPQFIKETSLE
ncbi:hypothetical protein JW933_01580 [candidate division FCPU426 bacterium]|nr:hypothetical protein [candidate division FCPU426 bacterium]